MNKWLKGNGYWCPACQGSGRGEARDWIEYEGGGYCQFYELCATCKGQKRLPATVEQIVSKAVPATPSPSEHSCFLSIIEYGRLTPIGKLPRSDDQNCLTNKKAAPSQKLRAASLHRNLMLKAIIQAQGLG